MSVLCPICASDSTEFEFTHQKWGVPCNACQNCTHRFAVEHIVEEEDSFATNRLRAGFYLSAIRGMRPDSLMDIGTPRDFMWLSKTHELFPNAAKFALDLYDKPHPPFVEMLTDFPSSSVDLCTAFHVLEHIESPHEFLGSLVACAKHFIVEVPNCDSLDARLASSAKPHTHFFTEQSLRALFSAKTETPTRWFTIKPGGYGEWRPSRASCLVAFALPASIKLQRRTKSPQELAKKLINRRAG
jgi:hypothetical protein